MPGKANRICMLPMVRVLEKERFGGPSLALGWMEVVAPDPTFGSAVC